MVFESEIIKLYNYVMQYGGEGLDWDQEAYTLALHNPQEKQSLINLFEEEKDENKKVLLAHILARLGEIFVIPFLVEALEHDANTIAAFALLRLGYPKIQDIFIKVSEDKKVPRHWIVRPLYCLNTPLTNEILEELMRRDEKIREHVEMLQNDPDYKREIADNEW